MTVVQEVRAQKDTPGGPGQAVTYSKGVAPILRKNCVSCHNSSGGAPFSLTSYADARQWGGQILDVTQSRYMPPWLPLPDLHNPQAAHTFKGDRRLSDSDLETIRRWVGAGMPEGSTLPAATYDSTALLKQAGPAGLTISPSASIHVPASGPDIFLTFALPVPAGAAHSIRAIGIDASDPQAAHSIFIGVDEKQTLRTQHPEILQAGMQGMELPPEQTMQFAPGGQLLLWTPDVPLLSLAEPISLRGSSDVVLTVHIKTTGRAEDLSLKILLYFATPARPVLSHALVHLDHDDDLAIAAGNKQYVAEAQKTLEQPTTLTSIYPRAHYAARTLETFATLPDGSQRSLLTIDKWDADWSAIYRFNKPVALPKGSVLHMRWTYDNSSNNPHNPSDPPKTIASGHAAKDEVGEVWMETTASH